MVTSVTEPQLRFAAVLSPGMLPRETPAETSPGESAPSPPPVRAASRLAWLLPLLVALAAAAGWAMAQPGAPCPADWQRDGVPAAACDALASAPLLLRAWQATRSAVLRFRYIPGVTPLSAPRAPAAAVLGYFALLSIARRVVARRGRAFDTELQSVVFAHNVFLCCLSAALLAGLAGCLLPEYLAVGGGARGFMRVWCDPEPHMLATHHVTAFFYVNYLTKYYELLDTLFLVLRGRPTPFLHVFHHAATLVLCWTQLEDDTACQWLPIALNLAVHVAMYCYYALATLGHTVWWKRHLTSAQILQFAVDVPACVAALLLRMNSELGWGWLGGVNTYCRGTHRAAYVGIGLLGAYLALFIKLYIDIYLKPAAARPRDKHAATARRAKAE